MNDMVVKEFTSVKDRFTLTGKKAIVTGGKGGIGRSTAMAFAELGADVAVVDIPAFLKDTQEIAKGISEKYGVKAIGLGADLSKEQDVNAMVQSVVDQLGTIDIVFANAGVFSVKDTALMDLAEFKRIIDINLLGTFMVNKACAQVMIDHNHGGSIINTASMSGTIINPTRLEKDYMVAYTASKAAVAHMTRGMALNLISKGIRVNAISPGYLASGIHKEMDKIDTDWWANSVPIKRFGDMDEIVGIVCFLASDLSSYFVGSDILMDGGLCSL